MKTLNVTFKSMASQIVTLAPGLVNYYSNLVKEKLKAGASPLISYRGGLLYHVGDQKEGFYALVVKGEIEYFVHHAKVTKNGKFFGQQLLLKRFKRSTAAVGLPQKIFFEVLLTKYKTLITDSEQTEYGKGFWQYALNTIYTKKLNIHVYMLDRRGEQEKLIHLPTMNDLLSKEKEIWGEDDTFQYTHVVISLDKLH